MITTGPCAAFQHPGAVECKRYSLRLTDGTPIGVLTLVYNDADRWGELYARTEWGDYMYRWESVERKGFVRFPRDIDADYMAEKLETGMPGNYYQRGLRARVIPTIKRMMETTVAAASLAGDNPMIGFTAAHDPEVDDPGGFGYVALLPTQTTRKETNDNGNDVT